QVRAADGVDRRPELALQFANRHLRERLALMRSGHHAIQVVPDLLELLPEAERQQDLDAVGPQDNPRAGRAELRLALVVFHLEPGPSTDDMGGQAADTSSNKDDFHARETSPGLLRQMPPRPTLPLSPGAAPPQPSATPAPPPHAPP